MRARMLAEQDSNQFHAVCLDTYPPIFYLNDTSKKIIDICHKLNSGPRGARVRTARTPTRALAPRARGGRWRTLSTPARTPCCTCSTASCPRSTARCSVISCRQAPRRTGTSRLLRSLGVPTFRLQSLPRAVCARSFVTDPLGLVKGRVPAVANPEVTGPPSDRFRVYRCIVSQLGAGAQVRAAVVWCRGGHGGAVGVAVVSTVCVASQITERKQSFGRSAL